MTSFEKYIESFNRFIEKKKEVDKIQDRDFVKFIKNKLNYLIRKKKIDSRDLIIKVFDEDDVNYQNIIIILDYILLKKEEKENKEKLKAIHKLSLLKEKSKKRYKDGKKKYYKYDKKNKGVYLKNDKEKRILKTLKELKTNIKRTEGKEQEKGRFVIFGNLYFDTRREIESNICFKN